MARVECLSDYSLPRGRWYDKLRFSAVSCKLLMKTADFKSAEVYKFFAKIKDGLYITVVVKINHRNFILTAYLTDRIIMGDIYEKS